MLDKKRSLEDVNETSEELNEIIGRVPNKVFVRTTYSMLIVIVVFFISAYFISYPEKISGEITIYNQSQPLKIICQQNVQFARIFVQDGTFVKAGEPLALINNPTNYEGITYLRKLCIDYGYVFKNIDSVIANNNVALSFGDMQSEYNVLISNLLRFKKLINPANRIFNNTDSKERIYHEIMANIRNIDVFIRNWDQKFLIKALKSGKVSFLTLIVEGQYFKAGDELFAILTPNTGVFGIANILSEGIGNVEVGQQARIKIKKYPYYEYGFLLGQVKKISSVPINNTYKVNIEIKGVEHKQLEKKLKNEEEAAGEVDIITKEYTLLDRLFMNIYKTLI